MAYWLWSLKHIRTFPFETKIQLQSQNPCIGSWLWQWGEGYLRVSVYLPAQWEHWSWCHEFQKDSCINSTAGVYYFMACKEPHSQLSSNERASFTSICSMRPESPGGLWLIHSSARNSFQCLTHTTITLYKDLAHFLETYYKCHMAGRGNSAEKSHTCHVKNSQMTPKPLNISELYCVSPVPSELITSWIGFPSEHPPPLLCILISPMNLCSTVYDLISNLSKVMLGHLFWSLRFQWTTFYCHPT